MRQAKLCGIQGRHPFSPLCFSLGVGMLFLLAVLLNPRSSPGYARTEQVRMVVATPTPLVVYGAAGDARDLDLYPVLAYAAMSQRFLLVWLSLRNATAQNNGFDVYGQFLDPQGQPQSSPFRISDTNTVARSNLPTVASDGMNFVVAWTGKGAACQLFVQPVADANQSADQHLELGLTGAQHSPQLIYNPVKQQYLLAFVHGDDYLPPVLAGATLTEVTSCGNNAGSASIIRAATFHLENNLVKLDQQMSVSQGSGAALRPALSLLPDGLHAFITWEDRRNAAGAPYRFDVYGQRLTAELTAVNNNLLLTSGVSYENGDNSATWTPRPTLASYADGFLVVWFEHNVSGASALWSVWGNFVTMTEIGEKVEIIRMSFGQPHPNDAPTGFLTSAFDLVNQEFAIGISSHLEVFTGYVPSVRLQRFTLNGQLLRLDGSTRLSPGVGDRLDTALAAQLSLAMSNQHIAGREGYLVVYGKNAINNHARDYDIWSSRTEFLTPTTTATATPTSTILPLSTPTGSGTVTPTATPSSTPTTTATATPTSTQTTTTTVTPTPTQTVNSEQYQQNLPFVAR